MMSMPRQYPIHCPMTSAAREGHQLGQVHYRRRSSTNSTARQNRSSATHFLLCCFIQNRACFIQALSVRLLVYTWQNNHGSGNQNLLLTIWTESRHCLAFYWKGFSTNFTCKNPSMDCPHGSCMEAGDRQLICSTNLVFTRIYDQ